jgi:hypothetical protein
MCQVGGIWQVYVQVKGAIHIVLAGAEFHVYIMK